MSCEFAGDERMSCGDELMIEYRYHHLNHYSMFGGSYKGSAMRIMKRYVL